MRISDRNRQQRGAALLFALGILSLILVMGLAFLGNSLISQKLAFNSQESASAAALARSAVDRAMAHLTLFNLLQVNGSIATYIPDASSVFSRKTEGTINVANNKQARDQIHTGKSKFSVMRRFSKTAWYDGRNSLAEWIYIHEDGTESDGSGSSSSPIKGRFAYQVLPASSNSRLSLYAVTSGINALNGTAPDHADFSKSRVPHLHRWGVDVDELVIPELNSMFSEYWGTDVNKAYPPQYEFDNFINLLSGNKAPNPFADDDENVENRKRWLEHIFSEGMGRMAREAYFGGRDGNNLYYFPRFNLSDFTKVWNGSAYVDIPDTNSNGGWYQRFTNKNQNDEDARKELDNDTNYLDDFLDKYLAYVPSKDKSHYYSDSYIRDTDCTKPIGLPFLRRIGNNGEKGAFDTVANLRKQIAANLNDYCDSDSIPTSDVDPATWKTVVENNSTAPRYTGNEKTPYVNEIGFEFKLNGSTLDIDTGKYVFKPGLKGRLLAELIGIYRGLELHSAELYGKLNSLSVTLKVSIRGKVDMQYTKSGESTPTTTTADFTEGKEISVSTDFSLNLAGGTFTISDFVKNPTSNYWMGRGTDLTVDAAVSAVDFTDEIKSAAGLSGETVSFSNDNVTHVKVEVTDVKFNLGNLALKVKDKETNPTVDGFVDFVRVDAGVRRLTGTCNLFNKDGDGGWIEKNKLAENTAETPAKGFFYVGSMQAIDSRQNLFAKLDNVKESDWFCSFEPSFGDPEVSHQLKWDALNKTGRVNVGSAPDSPSYANSDPIAVTARDAETTNDPAWQGDAANQHISTAVIRNAPMRSPWELGFIHRGIPFQTINLKKAGGIEFNSASAVFAVIDDNAHDPVNFSGWENANGTSYLNGDAGILDQIKMTEYNKSYGKLDFSALKSTPANMIDAFGELGASKLAVFKGLFENIKYHKPFEFISSSTSSTWAALDEGKIADTYVAGDAIGTNPATVPLLDGMLETRLRSKALVGTDDLKTALTGRPEQKNDAAQEELVGKTINLTEGISASLPQVFKIVVVAQTIRDLKGDFSRFNKHNKPVMAKSSEGLGADTEAAIGTFDAKIDLDDSESSIYFDEILSECRMLVTVEKIHYMEGNTPRARLRVKQIEYLD